VRQRTDSVGALCYDEQPKGETVKIYTAFRQAGNFIVGLLIGLALVVPFLA